MMQDQYFFLISSLTFQILPLSLILRLSMQLLLAHLSSF